MDDESLTCFHIYVQLHAITNVGISRYVYKNKPTCNAKHTGIKLLKFEENAADRSKGKQTGQIASRSYIHIRLEPIMHQKQIRKYVFYFHAFVFQRCGVVSKVFSV